MRLLKLVKAAGLLMPVLVMAQLALAQPAVGRSDSWQEVFANKKGSVTALWDDIEPFIYINHEGALEGVEYEIMESLKPWLKLKYGIELSIVWQRAGSFDNIYQQVKTSQLPGVFGWSYYSITAARQKEVQFSLPYMPDLNVLVTNNREPMYASSQEFTGGLKEKRAYTLNNTTMQEDVLSLRNNFYPKLPVTFQQQDYEVMRSVAQDEQGFGYVPLSLYIVGLQKGIKVKRQNVLSSRRAGFAAVLPKGSDWKPVIDEYFSSELFRLKAGAIVTKYLGSEVKDLVFDSTPTAESTPDLDLVSLEKEIVTKRLMDTAVEVQQQKSFRNIMLVLLGSVTLLGLVLYSRFRTRQKLNRQLSKQNDQIEQMNQLLKLKILQARMNPHFLFNSLNSIQYFITGDDKKASLQYISRFSAFLRKVINFGDELFISVRDEAELLKEYLWLEHYRFQDKFEYGITIAPSAQDATILPLLTHSLVEDALYKGVLNLSPGRKGKLSIGFTMEQGMLVVRITDDGTTREYAADLEKRKGLGNGEEPVLVRRIDLYNAQGQRKITRDNTAEQQENGGQLNRAILKIPQPLFDPLHL